MNLTLTSLSLEKIYGCLISNSKYSVHINLLKLTMKKSFGSAFVGKAYASSGLNVKDSSCSCFLSPVVEINTLALRDQTFTQTLAITGSIIEIDNCRFFECQNTAISTMASGLILKVNNSVFDRCYSNTYGGAISSNNSVPSISFCCFSRCKALCYGMAVYLLSDSFKHSEHNSYSLCPGESSLDVWYGALCYVLGGGTMLMSNFSDCYTSDTSSYLSFYTHDPTIQYIHCSGGVALFAIMASVCPVTSTYSYHTFQNISQHEALVGIRESTVILFQSVILSRLQRLVYEYVWSSLTISSSTFVFDPASIAGNGVVLESINVDANAQRIPFVVSKNSGCFVPATQHFSTKSREYYNTLPLFLMLLL